MNTLRNKKFLILAIFSSILFACSNHEIDEEVLENCKDLVHTNGLTTLNEEIFSGSCMVYNLNGTKNSLISFKDGRPNGIHRGYFEDGSLKYQGYRKKGEIHGKYTGYHSNGQVEAQGKFKFGIYDGKWNFCR